VLPLFSADFFYFFKSRENERQRKSIRSAASIVQFRLKCRLWLEKYRLSLRCWMFSVSCGGNATGGGTPERRRLARLLASVYFSADGGETLPLQESVAALCNS
jgi:hypothetical protein